MASLLFSKSPRPTATAATAWARRGLGADDRSWVGLAVTSRVARAAAGLGAARRVAGPARLAGTAGRLGLLGAGQRAHGRLVR